jgi:hypothetical protein
LKGARWDINIGSIADSRLKELHPNMPVMYIKAVTQVGLTSWRGRLLTSEGKTSGVMERLVDIWSWP